MPESAETREDMVDRVQRPGKLRIFRQGMYIGGDEAKGYMAAKVWNKIAGEIT
jgi:hypothetical protein